MRWVRATFLPASLLILGAAGMFVPLPLEVLSPGRVVPLASCVEVDDSTATAVKGDYLLMTVNVLRASTFDAVLAAVDPETSVDRPFEPPGVDREVFFRQQREDFQLSRDVAVVVGLQEAGLQAKVIEEGVRVFQAQPGTPAARALRPGDIITQIDEHPVPNVGVLREILSGTQPGAPLAVRVRRGAQTLTFDIAPVELAGSAVLGVQAETALATEVPFEVDVAAGGVGGTSAGLTIALTVYDMVAPDVDLAAGRTIAVTGTLDHEGRVGPVGGAGLKTLAADEAGADVFLVPAGVAPEARAALPDGSDLEIVGVETFTEALEFLTRTADDQADGAPLTDTCPYQGV